MNFATLVGVPPKGNANRDELVEEQLRGIKEDLGDLKSSLLIVSNNLDAVRISEMAALRANLSDLRSAMAAELATHAAELKLLRYQMGRTSAAWGLISSVVASTLVAGVMALLMQH